MQSSKFILLILAGLFASPVAAQDSVTSFDQPQTAGISGFRAHWNLPIPLSEDGAVKFVDSVIKDRGPTAVWSQGDRRGRPGVLAFDALNRSLLVRFPGSATAILNRVRQGYAISKIELVLPYRDTELWPPGDINFAQSDGYFYRSNFGVDQLYRKLAPQWHAVAWGLRRAWKSDELSGPTFNAYVNGKEFWTKYGATDTKEDRFPFRFGPVEISEKAPDGRLDVTALVSELQFGETLASRLQLLDCCGFIVNKQEIYDARYFMSATGAYEWATATGGRAIFVRTPRLVVSFTPRNGPGSNANAGNETSTATSAPLRGGQSPSRGGPTAKLPSEKELAELTQKFATKPSWMPPWQWDRIAELKRLAGTQRANQPFYYAFVPGFVVDRVSKMHGPGGQATPNDVYGAWIDSIIGRQPRGWSGFEPASEMTQWFLYGDALPAPARDAFLRYWTAWLMPDRQAGPVARHRDQSLVDGSLVHPQIDSLAGGFQTSSGVTDSYYAKTGDWRGNKSFYRSGYNYSISTENFNHTAAVGALLGGAIIGSTNAIADGRHGWETFPVRLWSWSLGASQENIDHAYFAITLSARKVVADFGPTQSDRLISEGILAKSMDELVAAYHPALKRFISGSSRTSLEYLLAEQDGLQYLLHTLSRVGTLHDIDNSEAKSLLPGLQTVLGQEVPPLRVAMQTIKNPWAPEWVANLIDEKPLPYRAIAAGDGLTTSFLGKNYGVATVTKTRRIQFLAQWKRAAQPVEKMNEIVTVVARYGVNETRFANDAYGWIAPVGSETFLQYDNKVLMTAGPRDANFLREKVQKEGLKSLQTSIALFNYQRPAADWEIYVDGVRIGKLPYITRAGAKITIRDGSTFFSVIPLPGTDLGGGNTVVLREGTAQEWSKIIFKPALVIDSFNLKSERVIASPDWDLIRKAVGGFAIELADSSDYPTFEAFQNHVAHAVVQTQFDDLGKATASYRSDNDILETKLSGIGGELRLVEPKVNGRSAVLSPGLLRDTTTSIQGTAAAIEKLGAVLRGDEGRMKFLQVEPKSGNVVGWNPLPDLAKFSLVVPGGSKIQSDGRIGLARVLVNPRENRVTVTSVWREGQERDQTAATALVLTGFSAPPAVELNGAIQSGLPTRTIRGARAYIIPLQSTMKSVTEMERALAE